MKIDRTVFIFILILMFCVSCIPVAEHRQAVRNADADRLSVGKVQREIRTGMSSAQVVEVLGSPNMVTTDEKRREVWVYDKIATEHAYSTSSGGISALILGGRVGGSSALGGGVGPGFSKGTGATSTSQRTLTIIIKFDEQNKVRDFAYRQSSF
jgi:outer membrane protein assembly factor BamE (lipoprotein component of BamABCDE complex)